MKSFYLTDTGKVRDHNEDSLIILENNNHYGFIDTASGFYYPMIEKHLEEYNIKELEFID